MPSAPAFWRSYDTPEAVARRCGPRVRGPWRVRLPAADGAAVVRAALVPASRRDDRPQARGGESPSETPKMLAVGAQIARSPLDAPDDTEAHSEIVAALLLADLPDVFAEGVANDFRDTTPFVFDPPA